MTNDPFAHPESDPLPWLHRWLDEAPESKQKEPLAMSLATSDADGQPHCRIVLLKGFHGDDPRFFTNYLSDKGQELTINPRVALCFWWDALGRQIRIQGQAYQLPPEESDAYFASRPRGSQLGAWASSQSEDAQSRDQLEAQFAAQSEKFGTGDVPRPDHWGGYGVVIEQVEFWQARDNRFHDRIQYRKGDSGWRHRRLQP